MIDIIAEVLGLLASIAFIIPAFRKGRLARIQLLVKAGKPQNPILKGMTDNWLSNAKAVMESLDAIDLRYYIGGVILLFASFSINLYLAIAGI